MSWRILVLLIAVVSGHAAADIMQPPAVTCLALNVYYEARGEPYEGQMAVAQVAVRRAGFDEDWICPAVYAGRQFSWTSRINRTLPRPRDLDAWHRAQSVARMALLWGHLQHVPDYSRGATHYHSIRVRPSWSLRMREVARIGRHRFYRDGTS